MSQDATAQSRIAAYEQLMKRFLHRRHRVLILFPEHNAGSFGWQLAQAVERCGCVSVSAQGDFRWKNLLWLAFFARTETVIGSAHMILGLHKAAKATNTPLFIHDVLLCGGCKPWQKEGLQAGLDCRVWQLEPDAGPEDDPMFVHNPALHSSLEDQLLNWSSVLDFSVTSTQSGMDLEVVTFPGEKMPPLPSCAKLTIRSWDPETDVPFPLKISEKG